MWIISPDAAQDADVVGADMQDATLPVGQQPTSERIEQREGRDVLVVYIARFVMEGTQIAAGNPTVAGDDQPQLVFAFALSGGVDILGQERNWSAMVDGRDSLGLVVLPWKFERGAKHMSMHRCARTCLSLGAT